MADSGGNPRLLAANRFGKLDCRGLLETLLDVEAASADSRAGGGMKRALLRSAALATAAQAGCAFASGVQTPRTGELLGDELLRRVLDDVRRRSSATSYTAHLRDVHAESGREAFEAELRNLARTSNDVKRAVEARHSSSSRRGGGGA